MRIDRDHKVVSPEVGGDPYRPLFVETEPMKVKFYLTTEEVQEAVEAWLAKKGYETGYVEDMEVEARVNTTTAKHSDFELVLTVNED